MEPFEEWSSRTRHLQGYTPSDNLLKRMSEGEEVPQEEIEADEDEFIRRRQLQERQQQQHQPNLKSEGEEDDGDDKQQQHQPNSKSEGEEDDAEVNDINYYRCIIEVLAESQSKALRPVNEKTIRGKIVSEYLRGDNNAFDTSKFWKAIIDGVGSGRFFQVRDSYFLANKRNQAYDPKVEIKSLDDEEYNEKQWKAMFLDYQVEYGLCEYEP